MHHCVDDGAHLIVVVVVVVTAGVPSQLLSNRATTCTVVAPFETKMMMLKNKFVFLKSKSNSLAIAQNCHLDSSGFFWLISKLCCYYMSALISPL
jgi:hypothetical protein